MTNHRSATSTDETFSGSMRHAPWWAQLIAKFGFGVAVASVLLYWLIFTVTPKIDNIDKAVTKIEPRITTVDEVMRLHVNDTSESSMILRDIKNIMIQDCFDRRKAAGQTAEGCFGERTFTGK